MRAEADAAGAGEATGGPVLVQFGRAGADLVRDGLLRSEVPGLAEVDVLDVPPDGDPPSTSAAVILSWGAPNLLDVVDRCGVRWLHYPGTGVDSLPLRELSERGVVVTCSRGVSGIPIAEFVMAAVLAFEKDVPDVWIEEPPERWNMARLGELAGKRMGLVGLGGIGREVARRATVFDMEVRALRHSGTPSDIAGVEVVRDLDAALEGAHHVVVAAPLTDATHGMLDREAFSRMREGAHLVNVSRGKLVDQDALREALDAERLALATLDVVDPEPLPAGHWIYSHPRIRLSAHVSWSSPKAMARIAASFAENLRRWRAGEPLGGIVDESGY